MNPARRCLGGLLLLCLLGAGCRSGWHSVKSGSSSGKQAATPVNRRDLERRAEAGARYAAGVAYDLRGETQAADEAFTAAAAADPGNEKLTLALAQRLLQRRETGQAIQVLNRSAARRDATGHVAGWLGLAYAQKGATNEARAAFRTAIRKAPDLLLGYHGLAQLELELHQPLEALRVVDEAAARPHTDALFQVSLAEFLITSGRGHGLTIEQVKPRALKLVERAARSEPSDPSVRQRLAGAYKNLGELPQATALYRQLLEPGPTRNQAAMAGIREQLVQLYLASGQHAEAMSLLREILQDNPANPRFHYLLGSLAFEQRKTSEAEAAYRRAIELDPSFEPAYHELALVQSALGDPEAALATLTEARSRFKAGYTLEFYTGIAYATAKQYPEAIKAYVAAELFARAEDPSRLNQAFYFQVGVAYERAGNFPEAERNFRHCLELAPDHAEAMNYLGYSLAERGERLAEARDLIAGALKVEPENPAYLDSMAWVYFKLGKAAEGLPLMERAIALSDKPDATLYDHLGDILAALGRQPEAQRSWRRSLELEASDVIRGKLGEPVGP